MQVIDSDGEEDIYAEPAVWPPVPSPKGKALVVKAVASKPAIVRAKAAPVCIT